MKERLRRLIQWWQGGLPYYVSIRSSGSLSVNVDELVKTPEWRRVLDDLKRFPVNPVGRTNQRR